jgi:glucose-1-phosphate thymidylyltransferase
MKGIVLAGGRGTRLYPLTHSISKQLLPIYDKPMIFYPLSVLMLAGIREIAIITTPNDIDLYKKLLGNGEQYGVTFNYIIQEKPEGIPQAFILGADFIKNEKVCLILGDNIFFGYQFSDILKQASLLESGAGIFTTYTNDPTSFAIAEVDDANQVISLQEKPVSPKSNLAVTGLYFYDNNVIEISKSLKPSERGELEITDINKVYLEENNLKSFFLGRGFAWLDTGSHSSLLNAGEFVKTIEERQGLKIACLEEIAFNSGWITEDQVAKQAKKYISSPYGKYLEKLI